MNNPSLFCTPIFSDCLLMSEWAVYWQAAGICATILFGCIGLYKIYRELVRLNEQREKDAADKESAAKLKRTEFFLAQHRRLFDNPELFEVLCLIDEDSTLLKEQKIWDKKRKFLTFFEEITLLVESDQIKLDVAMYMFGHYARCARYGHNFSVGINLAEAHWRLFYKFSDWADQYFEVNPDGPKEKVTL